MIDLGFLNFIFNIFTVLLLLYKFTSIFSYICGFIKFLGRFVEGLIYLKNQFLIFIEKRRGQYVPRQNLQDTFFNRLYKGVYYILGYKSDILPSYQTELFEQNSITPQDRQLFDQQLTNTMEDSDILSENSEHKIDNSFTSICFNNDLHIRPDDSNIFFKSSFIRDYTT